MILEDRLYQDEDVDYAMGHGTDHKVIHCSPTGCHAAGTPILLWNGTTKPAEKIRVGDELMGPDSRRRQVTALHAGVDEMFEVTPVKGDPFQVNGDHILAVKRTGDGTSMAGQTELITVRNWLGATPNFRHVIKLYRVGVDFNCYKNLSPILSPYFVGALLGDGDLQYGRVGLTTADQELIDEVYAQAKRYNCTVRVYAAGGKSSNYNFSSGRRGGRDFHRNSLLRVVRNLGMHGLSSATKFVPSVYRFGSRQVRLEVLAGLLDTDGHLSGNGYDFVSKSEQLALDITFIARSVGLAAYLKKTRKSCGDFVGDYYRVLISGDTSQVPCRIARKQAQPRKQKKDVLVTGFTVTPVGLGKYFGFECDGDHLYLMGDFTVTHNSGKTIIQAKICKREIDRGDSTAILTPRNEIFDQTYRHVTSLCGYSNVSKLRAKRTGEIWHPTNPVHIVSWNTLIARVKKSDFWFPNVRRVLVDECHLSVAPKILEILHHYAPKARIDGYTATPARLTGRGLGHFFTEIKHVTTVRQLIKDGYLAPVEYWGGATPDLKGIKVRRGDYETKKLSGVCIRLVGDAVDNWLRLAHDRHTIVFAVDIAHCEALAERYQRVGIKAAALHTGMEQDDRDAVVSAFKAQRIQVLVNVSIASYGFDAPSVNCIQVCRPTKSIVLHLQMIGRGMRPKPDGGECMVLDHAGNVRALGMADDLYRWRLDEGRQACENWTRREESGEKDEAKEYECEDCHHIFSRSRVCPKCGWKVPYRKRDVEAEEADLVPIGRNMVERLPEGFPSHEVFYGMLRHYAHEKGRKPMWAVFKFEEKAGCRPPYDWNNHALVPPNERVKNWIISRNIAYAKAQQKRKAG